MVTLTTEPMSTNRQVPMPEPWRGLYGRLIKLGAAILGQRHWGDPIKGVDAEKQDDALADLGMEARRIADAIAAAALAALAMSYEGSCIECGSSLDDIQRELQRASGKPLPKATALPTND